MMRFDYAQPTFTRGQRIKAYSNDAIARNEIKISIALFGAFWSLTPGNIRDKPNWHFLRPGR
jgi:hypothetical protein